MSSFLGRVAQGLIEFMVKTGVFNTIRHLTPSTLTVLNYHRIDDPYRDGFDTFKPNISATPGEFVRQMDYVKKNYNVINCKDLTSFLQGDSNLPPHAAMITFDDGYYDNFSNAFPVLRERNLPAVIFLTTAFMGSNKPFYWDYVAYCFHHTDKNSADLPLIGVCSWTDEKSRYLMMERWIENVKRIPEAEKRELIQGIGIILNVEVPVGAFSNLYLTWDQIREMSQGGLIEFGSHTVNHPILTRVSLEEAAREVAESKGRIEQELGKPVISLAYPNGGEADFSSNIIQTVESIGVKVAFSLLPGPTSYKTVKKQPLAIRRIFLTYKDNYARFVAKVSGLSRMLEDFRR